MPYAHERRETLLKVEDLSLTLGGNLILRDIDVEVKNIVRPGLTQGQVVGFLGPSGIGKTQFFKRLAGLEPPTTGRVLIGPEQKPVQCGQMGVVTQNYVVFDDMTAFENLVFAARQGAHKRPAEKAREMLEEFDLGKRGKLYPKQLSGGQRQRLAIARQILCSDKFLLMDEPFSGLDPIMVEKVSALIAKVAAMDELFTIIVVTHDIAAAVQVSDTLWLMGRDRGADGQFTPGARIKEEIDLIGAGLAWRPDIALTPEFSAMVRGIKGSFHDL